MHPFLRLIFACFFLCLSVTVAIGQTAAALEAQAQQSNDRRESMKLYYQAAEKYMSANPSKAAIVAHQAYLTAVELNDNAMAARAAFLNAEGYAKQSRFGEAKFRYNRGKESALTVKDLDFAAKCLDKMANMARSEGNTKEATTLAQQAKELRTRKGDVAVTPQSGSKSTLGKTTAGKPNTSSILSTPQTRPANPTNQAEFNQLREQYKQQMTQFETEKQRLALEVANLQRQKDEISKLRQKDQQITEQAQQAVVQKDQQLASVKMEKDKFDRIASKRQELLKALQSGKSLDSLAFAQDLQEQELLLQKSKSFRNVLLLVLGFGIVMVGLMYRRYLENQKQKKQLQEKNRQIQDQQQRSDELLLNILPAAIAEELKVGGKAKARRYEQASVLFVDFKSFTKISEQLSPEELVAELDHYFKAFDFIIGQYKLEKIKTIGDAYMVASGLSDRITSPLNIVRAAVEMQEFLTDMKQEKSSQNKPIFEARMGIHTGPVVAGVVGVKKFAYDIWGDTVNIAARVQEACEPNEINITEAVYNEIRYSFTCKYRGKLPAKNKEAIDMYYVGAVSKSS
ncbi:MAG: adenylate/guanylate cyclase domain-containing protein [Saprospiraceae bacterium]|nr:adenylate/guanylate cyclase domain-containing protein [Saprospiraceae bacterium]